VTGLRRFNSSGVEETSQAVNYRFDTNPFDGAFTQNGQGRVAAIESKAKNGATGAVMTFVGMLSYTSAGSVTKKRLRTTTTATADLEASFTYNNEGVRPSMTYPHSHDASYNALPGRTFNYSFDAMKRLTGMTEVGTGQAWVSGVSYNAAGQWTQMTTPAGVETRQYNVLGQMTRMTIPGVIDFEYTFSRTSNNGRITKMKDWVSGEEVNYAYDSLNRLISAVTTGPEYGLSFTYDGFGNKTGQALTKGSAPVMSVAVDPGTNRVVGVNYDANGNQNGTAGWNYDVANRLVAYNTAEYYGYVASNRRVWKRKSGGVEEVYFYDVTGQRIGTYELQYPGGVLRMVKRSEEFYFAGKLVRSGDQAIALDRLASVWYRRHVGTGAVERHDFYPYGEEKPGATAHERDKFATYHRDGTGLDYADQRYFNSQWGRFATPDPYDGSCHHRGQGTQSLYSYASSDPAKNLDRHGLFSQSAPAEDLPANDCSSGLPIGGGSGGGAAPSGNPPEESHNFRKVTKDEREEEEDRLKDLLKAASKAGESDEQEGKAYPKYLKVVGDYNTCWGKVVQRNVSYLLMGSDGAPMNSGVVTENLFPIDYDTPIITRPSVNSSSGQPNGTFNDEISVQLGSPREYLQTFTARGGNLSLVGFVDVPVFVWNDMRNSTWQGQWSILNVHKTREFVEINRSYGPPSRKCN